MDDTVDMDNMDDTSMDSMDYSHDMDDMDEIICSTYCIPSIDKLINHIISIYPQRNDPHEWANIFLHQFIPSYWLREVVMQTLNVKGRYTFFANVLFSSTLYITSNSLPLKSRISQQKTSTVI